MNCRDRRGLLSDVITALKSIPLEITTAAVTTTADGYVYDVFQVNFQHLLACCGWQCSPSHHQSTPAPLHRRKIRPSCNPLLDALLDAVQALGGL